MNYYDSNIRNFIFKQLLFWLPIILVIVFLEFFLFYSGEISIIDSIVKKQISNENILYGKQTVSEEVAKIKYKNIENRKADVLILGSSRVLQIRKEMFSDQYNFYNAGLLPENFNDLETLTQNNLLKNTKLVILGIDSWWFDKKRNLDKKIIKALQDKNVVYNSNAHISAGKYLFKQIFRDPNYFVEIIKKKEFVSSKKPIGLKAYEGNGFRNDGSRQYGTFIFDFRENQEYVDREGPPIISRVKEGLNPFFYDMEWNEEAENLLKNFLDYCLNNDIVVIGLALPFSSEVFDELSTSDRQKLFFNSFREKLPDIFKDKKQPFFDFSDLKNLGLNDLYMIDGFHMTETAAAQILLKIFYSKEINSFKFTDMVNFKLNDFVNNKNTTPFELFFN